MRAPKAEAEPSDAADSGAREGERRAGPWGGDLVFAAAVVAVYAIVTALASGWHSPVTGKPPDRMLTLAQAILDGHLDSPLFQGTTDSVARAGHYYIAVGPLQVAPYLPLAILGGFRETAGFVASGLIGGAAALLALPLARSYGAEGGRAYAVAAFAAFGSLLFFLSVFGNFYYLAQVESFLALAAFLIEWARGRRPIVLGFLLGLSFLARPTTLLAALPFGVALVWRRRDWFVRGLVFAAPILLAIAVYGLYNWARFGSPLESGYAISYLPQPGLADRRALGLFSVVQLPENVHLSLLAGFRPLDHFPYFTADPYGLSMLLVSPALLTAAWAARDRDARVLWAAAGLVAVPVFLYYGGGYFQYGFRYSLDFTPFLVALMAMGSKRWIGRPEWLLVAASIASVSYGILWCGNAVLRT